MLTQLKKGVLDLIILAYIFKQDNYGYKIYKYVDEKIGISESTVYPILRKYTKAGLCATYLVESDEGPARKYFTITDKGVIELKKLRETYEKFDKEIKEILVGDSNE